VPPNPSEATNTKPEATKAKPESHQAQGHANASNMDHSDAASITKPQPAQVQDSDRHNSNSNINDNTLCSIDDSTDNGERSACDDSLSTNSPNSDTGDCYRAFDPGGDRLNDKHKGTATREDGGSTCDDSNNNGPLSALASHSFGILDNFVHDPESNPFNRFTVDFKPNPSSLSSSKLTYEHGGFSGNSNSNWFVCDPGGTRFGNTLDHADATTASDHGDHIFDPGGVPFHSGLPSSRVRHNGGNLKLVFDPGGDHFHGSNDLISLRAPHDIGDCNRVYNPGGIPFVSSKSFRATSTNHDRDRSTTSSSNKATKSDDKAATPCYRLTALSRRRFNSLSSSRHPRAHIQGILTAANAPTRRNLSLTQEGQNLNPPGGVRRAPAAASELPSSSFVHSSLTSGHVGPFVLAVRVLSPAGAHSLSHLLLRFPRFAYWTH
jgi:hypothetical protein